MSNNITIRNIDPQQITISGSGQPTGITNVYVNGVDVTVGTKAYVLVPTNNNELLNGAGYITAEEETDPTVPSYVKAISLADINSWNDKQDQLVSGSTIKTINSESLLGSGNIEIVSNYTAGDGIDITDNVISNTITSYNDLSDRPTIPTRTSDLVNDSGFITNQTDSLVNYLTTEVLEDILPHTSDSGTGDLYLEDSVKYKIKMELNPSEIQQKTTTGKNLLNVSSTYSVTTQDVISIELPSGTYTISANDIITNVTSSAFLIQLSKTDSTTQNVYVYFSTKVATFSVSEDVVSIKIYSGGSYGDSDGKTTTFYNLMIESGSTATEYEEYTGGMPSPNPLYPQDIHVTSGENMITVCGKNLFDKETAQYGRYYVTTGISNSNNWYIQQVKVKPSTSYYLSGNNYNNSNAYIVLLDKDKNIISSVGTYPSVHLITTTSTTEYIGLSIADYTGTADMDTIMLEYGTSVSTYEPYQSQEYPIDLSDFLTYWGNNDLCKITSPYGVYETVIFLNSKYHRYHNESYSDNAIIYNDLIQKVILDGSEDWIISGSYFETSIGSPDFGSTRTYAISNYFTDKSKVIDTVNESYIWTNGPFIDIHISPSLNINTVEDFTTWLSNNNVVIYAIKGAVLPDSDYFMDGFEEEDPVYQEYKDLFDNSTSYDGGTNISQENDDLPFDIEADTLRKIS